MKSWINTSRSVVATVLASTALLGAGTSLAHADTLVYSDAPQGAAYASPYMMPVDLRVNIGWHGDRYYDGHRYWAHDDWMHRHPHAHDPRHDHDHGPDHR